MINKPLSSSDLGKLLIFGLLSLPTILYIVGIVPAIFLGFGIFMMKKSGDFSHIETAARNYRGFMKLGIALTVSISTIIGGYYFYEVSKGDGYSSTLEAALSILVIVPVLLFYIAAMNRLFLTPLRAHSDWVAKNGIFSSTENNFHDGHKQGEISIIKGERLKSYSVADELLKWAKLKEDGHITEEQYNEARNKILQGD